ncbi:MAG: hypothetical protein K6U02_07560 [Firmicutes bacterium]|nr:hypothetical protein [Bacillota bacterium]
MTQEKQVEQAVARALRDALAALQRPLTELEQALNDLVAACASSQPANVLPPTLRAQLASTSLAAALEALARFIRVMLHPPVPAETQRAVGWVGSEAPATPSPEPPAPQTSVPMAEAEAAPRNAVTGLAADPEFRAVDMVAEGAPVISPEAAIAAPEEVREAVEEAVEEVPEERAETIAARAPAAFDLSGLTPEEQELHRRANRVAKVSMQDLKMLHPEQVRLGREHRDLCSRLREEIDKARKEYDRRFAAILHHPVDYFYHWMVEILAEGDPEALGEYPYPSPVLKR